MTSSNKSRSSSSSFSKSDNNYQHNPNKQKENRIFDYELFFENDQRDFILKNESIIQSDIAKVDKTFSISDLDGVLIRFVDKQQIKKYEEVIKIFKLIHEVLLDTNVKYQKDKIFTAICLVPNTMVSLVIGIKGKQINQIMQDSNAKVVANQPINNMIQRTIRIDGEFKQVATAIKLIYTIIEDRFSKVVDIENKSQQINLQDQEAQMRYVIDIRVQRFLEGKRELLRNIENDSSVVLRFYDDRKLRQLKNNEIVCLVKGKLQNIQEATIKLFQKIDSYYSREHENKNDYYIKFLIPNKYVTKLIGAGGCMIKDISQKSKGALIKIVSNKDKDNRDQKECLVSIAGTINSKIDACCLIVQQLEIFKNGGPILISGKSINDNLVNQFNNSIQDQEQQFLIKKTQKQLSPFLHKQSSERTKKNIKSRSRSNKERQNKRKKSEFNEKTRRSPQQKKIFYEDFEGKIRFLINCKLAKKMIVKNTLANIKNQSNCQKIYFDEDSDCQGNNQFKKLTVKGNSMQNNNAFNLIQREIFSFDIENGINQH